MSSNAKNASGKPLSLVWLRRDLRLYDHRVFSAASKQEDPVQPVFVFDTDVLARFTLKNDRRLTFIAATLCRLHEQMKARSGGLLVLYGLAQEIIPRLCDRLEAKTIFSGEDFEPETRRRDAHVKAALEDKTVFTQVMDHLMAAPSAVLKSDGTPYKVFTPYFRAWREAARAGFADEALLKGLRFADFKETLAALQHHRFSVLNPEEGAESMLAAMGYAPEPCDWPVDAARKRLHDFAEKHMQAYDKQRDFMAQAGTSRLSPYLRFGLLSIRECARLAFEREDEGGAGALTWLKELVWRDFYAMILYHFPDTATQEMQEQYRDLKWSYDKNLFRQFTEGRTGYPVIDAAMRELLTTGYMHNRARMIVASFMTKDLLLDWRMGEEHFAQYLMDYELSSNVGGWQWAASTGTDAQPYFRIFNPLLQSRRFDPEGVYIRRFVAELAHIEGDAIHEPWKDACPADYPKPIVEHAEVKEKAIAMFKKVSAA